MDYSIYLVYALPALVIVSWFYFKSRRRETSSRQVLQQSIDTGMIEPASLHPVIDPKKCIGCRSCTEACPEQSTHPVLGIIGGKAHLISPSNCIGHGACMGACPVDAIELVFGTERRGIDIPQVDPEFQSNVPGIYIAGELGGMGLIRNAVEQGRQAVETIVKNRQPSTPDILDVVIVGAGPAGFSASLGAMQHELSFTTLEQETLGGTVAHFPRGKLVMTQPVELPLYGKMKFKETSKEALLEFWQQVEASTGLTIQYEERVTGVTPLEDESGFAVVTTKSEYKARNILLTIGRRGTPRTLNVPGEERSKVVYRLIDPKQYDGQSVLIVGGGDSALEAACSITEESSGKVTLSYRSDTFSRAKPKNRERVKLLEDSNQLEVLYKSNVKNIEPKTVDVEVDGNITQIDNDTVIVLAGGILPTAFLKDIGITVETKYGRA